MEPGTDGPVALGGRADLAELAVRVMLGAIDIGDGGTEQQRNLVALIATLVLERPDLDIASLVPASFDELSPIVDDPLVSDRLGKLILLLELSRHPLVPEQVALVDRYLSTLGGGDGIGQVMAREMVALGIDEAEMAMLHAWEIARENISADAVRQNFTFVDDHSPELSALLRSWADLPRGYLGRECVEFFLRYDFTLPGEGMSNPAFWFQHDMTHLIAGYGPSSADEVALAAFHVGMADTDDHWVYFLSRLASYETGVLKGDDLIAESSILADPEVAAFVVDAFVRGSRCTGNLSEVELSRFVDRPIAEIREMFGVVPPSPPYPEHIS